VRRPHGQSRPDREAPPVFGPSAKLDVELELGFVIGARERDGRGRARGARAEHVFGVVLLNDWSARDLQAFESQPLGPFLGKSFATSISPWVTPMAALEPFRAAPLTPQEPAPADYLREEPWALDVALEIELNGEAIARTNARHLYWSVAQQIAHLTVNGASLRTGDLLGSGTISGPSAGARQPARALVERREPLALAGGASGRSSRTATRSSCAASRATARTRSRSPRCAAGSWRASAVALPKAIRRLTPDRVRDDPRLRALAVGTGVIPPRTMHSAGEAALLAELARGRRRVVEIGVFEGSSAIVLCDVLEPGAELHLIDPFGHQPNALREGAARTEWATRRVVERAARRTNGPRAAVARRLQRERREALDSAGRPRLHRRRPQRDRASRRTGTCGTRSSSRAGRCCFHDARESQPGGQGLRGPTAVVDRLFRGPRALLDWEIADESRSRRRVRYAPRAPRCDPAELNSRVRRAGAAPGVSRMRGSPRAGRTGAPTAPPGRTRGARARPSRSAARRRRCATTTRATRRRPSAASGSCGSAGSTRRSTVTAPPGDRSRLMVVEQTGRIMVVRGGRKLATPFLDIRSRDHVRRRAGPAVGRVPADYQRSGRFYVYYTSRTRTNRIVEYRRRERGPRERLDRARRADDAEPRAEPQRRLMLFGPTGSCTSGPATAAGRTTSTAGAATRRTSARCSARCCASTRGVGRPAVPIPSSNPFVARAGARGEIYAYGLRNPGGSRSTAAPATCRSATSARNASRRSTSPAAAAARGANFGWRPWEGRRRNFDEPAPGAVFR
jgi:2-keto-4-pentenoate hydratase/2-oxohepta-3-ene-1,7-dioic acid hydratase in catechol pathway